MSSAQQTDWTNWRGLDDVFPWKRDGQGFNKEQAMEVRLFQNQNRFSTARQERTNEFERRMMEMRDAFLKAEEDISDDTINPFLYKIWYRSIEDTRKETIPPYAFDHFPKLPVEIQLRIWSMACRPDEPRTHDFEWDTNDDSLDFGDDLSWTDDGFLRTAISCPPLHTGYECFPGVLSACRNSRAVALTVFTYLPISVPLGIYDQQTVGAYFNTLYDTYRIGGTSWKKFRVLLDLLIKFNTTRKLNSHTEDVLGRVLQIRNLLVDFNIFGAVPARIWTEFLKLEKLTIAFFPFRTIAEHEGRYENDPYDGADFIIPQRGYKHGKRRDWIIKHITEKLQAARDEFAPGWNLPKIEAVVKKTHTWADDFVKGEFTEAEVKAEDEGEKLFPLIGGQINPYVSGWKDDSKWYEQAAQTMTHTVDKEIIRELKTMYHPSRRVMDATEAFETGRPLYGYYTDSEHETRGPYTKPPNPRRSQRVARSQVRNQGCSQVGTRNVRPRARRER